MNKYQLPNGTYEFKPEHAEDVANLLADTFLELNDVWKSSDLQITELRQFFTKEIQFHFYSQEKIRREYKNPNIVLNYIAVANEQLVGIGMHLEIEEYRSSITESKESEVQLFRQLEKEGKQLIKAIDLNTLEKGKYLYATWGAHYKVPGASPMDKIFEAALGYDHIRSQGFKGMVFRSSSEKLVRMHQAMGSQIMHELPFTQNGKDFRIWLLRMEFDNPVISQLIEEAKRILHQGCQPKL